MSVSKSGSAAGQIGTTKTENPQEKMQHVGQRNNRRSE